MNSVDVHLYAQSQPVVHHGVRNTYTKDGLFCVLMADDTVWKFPTQHIFRVREYRA